MVKVKYCVYPGCLNNSRRSGATVKYFPFPKPRRKAIKCAKWLEICQKSCCPSAVNEHWFVCFKHFSGGNGPTESYPEPLPVATSADSKDPATEPISEVTTIPITDKSQFKSLLEKNTLHPSTLNSEDKSLLISNSTYEEFKQPKRENPTTEQISAVATIPIIDKSQFKALPKKNTLHPNTLNSEDKSLLISNSTYEEFERRKKSWLEKEMNNERIRSNERTNGTNQVSINSAFIQHLLSSQSSNNSSEFKFEICATVVKSEPEDYVDSDNCDQITPD